MKHYYETERPIENGIVVAKVKVTANFKMLINVCPDDIF